MTKGKTYEDGVKTSRQIIDAMEGDELYEKTKTYAAAEREIRDLMRKLEMDIEIPPAEVNGVPPLVMQIVDEMFKRGRRAPEAMAEIERQGMNHIKVGAPNYASSEPPEKCTHDGRDRTPGICCPTCGLRLGETRTVYGSYAIRRTEHDYAVAIEERRRGVWWTILQLVEGATRNEEEVVRVVKRLSDYDAEAARVQIEESGDTCSWKQNDKGYYEADCGLVWAPPEESMTFCPRCGRRLDVEEDTCTWTEDEKGAWTTSCGATLSFEEQVGPGGIPHGLCCPLCGDAMVEKRYVEPEGE